MSEGIYKTFYIFRGVKILTSPFWDCLDPEEPKSAPRIKEKESLNNEKNQ